MQTLLEHVYKGALSIEIIVKKVRHNVADRYQVKDRGYLREGYWADIVLADTKPSFLVMRSNVLSGCGWSPFEGIEFCSAIDTTIVNGVVVYENNQLDLNAP